MRLAKNIPELSFGGLSVNGNIIFFGYGRYDIGDDWTPSVAVGISKLYRIYGGGAYYRGRKLEVGRLYIFPECFGKWELEGHLDHLFFDFFMDPPMTINDIFEIEAAEYPAIDAFCSAASELFTGYKRRDVAREAKHILETLMLLCDKIVPLTSTGDERVDMAIESLCAARDIRSVPDIGELSDSVHLDKYYFIKLFSAKTGRTPMCYARDVLLSRAAARLEDGATVTEVATELGYSTPSAFTKAFRTHFGTLPSRRRFTPPLTGNSPIIPAKD